MFNQTFLELKLTFLSLYRLREVHFQWFSKLSKFLRSGRVDPLLQYKPRQDFDFKQRPSLSYYNKGLALFIITKVSFCIRYFSKTKSNPAKKNSEHGFSEETTPKCQNSGLFTTIVFSPESSLSMVLYSALHFN